MSDHYQRGVTAVFITSSSYTGRSSRDLFNADTARAQLECESRISRYGSPCTCGMHEATRPGLITMES